MSTDPWEPNDFAQMYEELVLEIRSQNWNFKKCDDLDDWVEDWVEEIGFDKLQPKSLLEIASDSVPIPELIEACSCLHLDPFVTTKCCSRIEKEQKQEISYTTIKTILSREEPLEDYIYTFVLDYLIDANYTPDWWDHDYKEFLANDETNSDVLLFDKGLLCV